MTIKLIWRRPVERATKSSSSNLGRVKQDVMKPRVDGRMAWRPRCANATQNECAHALPRSLGRQEPILPRGGIEGAPKLTTPSESEQSWTSSSHGVPWKRRECQDSAQLQEKQVDVHLKTLALSVDVVKPELQKDSQAADYATMIYECLDHERKGSGRHRPHLTRFRNRSCETCDRVETQSAELRSGLKFCAAAPSSLDGHLFEQRESDSVTQEKEIRCRGHFLRELERVSMRRRTRPLDRAATVMARRLQKQPV